VAAVATATGQEPPPTPYANIENRYSLRAGPKGCISKFIARRIMKLPHRRQFLHLAAGAAALPTISKIARAQTYPVKPVRIIAGYPAGGTTDILARLIGQWLSERLGQSFIIENRAGAGGTIAVDSVVRAPPDGYMLLLTATNDAYGEYLYPDLRYNYIRDIAPVATICLTPTVMEVNPSVPVKTIPEFVAYAKANPGKLNMGSGGIGTPDHLAGELFKTMAGVDMVHVPYRGAAPAVADLIAGQVQVMFGTMPASIEQIRAGKLRALAVTTATRSEALPNIPSANEFVPGYEASTWYGVGVPKNTPAEVVNHLNKEINAALADPKLIARLSNLGTSTLVLSPRDFGKLIAEDTEKWRNVIRATNIKAE
jgi:tripartite-type tricarboxylate transporter receptor subunit TctC